MTSRHSRRTDKSRALHWDERYREGGNLGTEPSPLLIRAVKKLRPGSALELACGAGRNSIYLARVGWRVTAVDISVVGIDILQRRAAEAGVTIEAHAADLEAGEFRIVRAKYDLVCNFYFLHRKLFPNIRAGIKPGGLFVGSIHMRDDTPGLKPMNPAYLLDDGELRSFFNQWEILYYREGKPEDSEHDRRAAEIIARRPPTQ